MPKMIQTTDSARLPRFDSNLFCSQGVSLMRNGNYVASVSKTGVINMYVSFDPEMENFPLSLLSPCPPSPHSSPSFPIIHVM